MSFFNYLTLPIIKKYAQAKSINSLPELSGTSQVEGITDTVEIFRDKYGVPHIFANNFHDALYAQGYVHAQDRLWHMEFNRRLANGTLAEIMGASALDTDRINRTLGFRRNAELDIAQVNQEKHDEFNAYIAGVNHYIKSHKKNQFPVEFKMLRTKPAEWKAEDIAAISRFFSFNMSFAWQSKIVNQRILEKIGDERANELKITYPEGNPITFGKDFEINKFLKDGRLKALKGPYLKPAGGSNAWSVSKRKSRNGHAYLCNDPHLPMIFPSFWYENHIVGGKLKVHGVSIPGMPLVKIGHNEHIAWGMTLSYVDTKDIYIEQFSSEKESIYNYNNKEVRADVVKEEIVVKGRSKPHLEKVIITRHGPVISEMLGESKYKMTLADVSLKADTGYIDGWYGLNMANNWDSFVESVKHLEAPSLNILYADVDGNAGHYVSGKIPVRGNKNNHLPLDGSNPANEWKGFVPFEEMPHALNPKQGFNFSCNHRLVGDDYPHYLGNFWMNGFRAKRLYEMMSDREKLEDRDFERMQQDLHCEPGYMLCQMYKGLSTINLRTMEIKNIITKWNGWLDEESIAGSVYQVVKQMLLRNVIEKELGPSVSQLWQGAGLKPPLFSISEFLGHDVHTLIRMLEDPNSWWIQNAGGREAVLMKSLEDAIKWLTEQYGEDQSNWKWGKLHEFIIPHVFGQKKPLEKIFNIGPIPIGGDTDTLCQTAYMPHQPYGGETGAPIYRQIINMGDFDTSVSVLTPGQSGNILSSHYEDQLSLWHDGKYKRMHWSRKAVEDNCKQKITLSPS